MKRFSCGTVMPGCDAQFQAESEEEILRQVGQHAHEQHGLDEIPTDTVERVRAHIVEA